MPHIFVRGAGVNQNLVSWRTKLAAGAVPKMLMVSDSLTEAQGNSSPRKGWGYQLKPAAQTVFIPCVAAWGGASSGKYGIGTVGTNALGETIRTSPSSVTSWWMWGKSTTPLQSFFIFSDMSGLSNVRVLWKGNATQRVDFKWPGGSDARVPVGTLWAGDIYSSPITGSGATLELNYSGADWIVLGIIADIGTPQVSVMNMSRSGARVADWNTWLADSYAIAGAGTGAPKNMCAGFNPDLINIGLGGNDYWDGVSAAAFEASYRTLIARLKVLCPNAGFIITTQPPGNDGATPNWEVLQNTTKVMASSLGIPVVDWHTLVPKPSADVIGWYSADGVHPTDAGSLFCADLARPLLL